MPLEIDVPLDSLKRRFSRVASLGSQGRGGDVPGFRDFDCYLFGNEARGLPDTATAIARAFTIPGTGAIESLNVAATVNICLYELNRE